MTKLKKPVTFETTFEVYVVDELLGEGGAGRVYGGNDSDGTPVALKVLAEERASTDKRSRFKNEISFQASNKHRNIVTVIDHGLARGGNINGPFYVMPRYKNSLRKLIQEGITPDQVLPLFSQILDGVEAAHLLGVVHRDIKPENVLHNPDSNTIAVADFGTARFTEDLLATTVETAPAKRLANFQYAAPEQRTPGQTVGKPADLYALGLILNEMFTGFVPQGTKYQDISSVSKEFGFLDGIVEGMIRQIPQERPDSIAKIKGLIQQYQAEAVSLQRLSQIDATVIDAQKIDDPLALEPPHLVDFDWGGGQLTLILNREVSQGWIGGLREMGTHRSLMNKGPEYFSFRGNKAIVNAQEHEVQQVINYFKEWLPLATRRLKQRLEQEARQQEIERKEELRREREAEERRLRVRQNTKI